ncbi:MAG TPA: hypothetical protein VFB52_02745, partial [Solirubrobacterales bacterium]|nr:hypothetical protein [Solirubrobacterales bacterium]
MRRIALIALAVALAATVVSVAVAAPAQQRAAKAPRVGIGPATALGPAKAVSKAGKNRPGDSKTTKPANAGGSTANANVLFSDSFDRADGLITNEYATWNPNSSQAVKSADWQMTSGSLFAKGGAGWTGVPDGCSSASASGSPCTASAVFRLNT